MILVERLVARRRGLKLLSAISSQVGSQIARKYLPDVILLGTNRLGAGDFPTLNILRGDPATAHIPVIALLSNGCSHDIYNYCGKTDRNSAE